MKTIAIRLPDVGVAILLEVLKLDKASRNLRRLVRDQRRDACTGFGGAGQWASFLCRTDCNARLLSLGISFGMQ